MRCDIFNAANKGDCNNNASYLTKAATALPATLPLPPTPLTITTLNLPVPHSPLLLATSCKCRLCLHWCWRRLLRRKSRLQRVKRDHLLHPLLQPPWHKHTWVGATVTATAAWLVSVGGARVSLARKRVVICMVTKLDLNMAHPQALHLSHLHVSPLLWAKCQRMSCWWKWADVVELRCH